MKRLLTFLAAKRKAGPLDESIKLAGGKDNHIIAGINLPSSAKNMAKTMMGKEGQKFASLIEFQSATLLLKMGDTTNVELIARYSNDSQASDAKKTLDGLRALAEIGLAAQEDMLGKEATSAAKSTLSGATIEQKGPAVTVK